MRVSVETAISISLVLFYPEAESNRLLQKCRYMYFPNYININLDILVVITMSDTS
jgi:hypothetical protein